MAENDTCFAIHNVNLRYSAPAKLDDLLTISTNCTLKRATTIQFNQAIINQSNELLCEGQIIVVCLNKILKPKRIPDSLVNYLINKEN
jgi:acyl-CoA thioester hydrolase